MAGRRGRGASHRGRRPASCAVHVWTSTTRPALFPTTPGAINGIVAGQGWRAIATALQFLDAFDRRNHPAFNQEFDAETSAMLQDYRSGLDYDTPQQKVERIQQSIDPANATVRKERRKEAEKVSDKFDIGDVGNVFDPSHMPMTEPGFGLLPDQQSQLLADYRSEYNKAFEASGDDGAARQVANDRIRSVWGHRKPMAARHEMASGNPLRCSAAVNGCLTGCERTWKGPHGARLRAVG